VSRRLRRAGSVPAVLSQSGGQSTMLTLDGHAFEQMLSRYVGENLIVTLIVKDDETLALLHEVQRHPVTGKVLHADFSEVARDVELTIDLPLVLIGEPVGVSTEGGILEQALHTISVSCLPGDVVEAFEIEVGELKLGDVLSVSDLKLGDAFTILTPIELAVATVAAPRVSTADDADEDDDAEAAVAADGEAESEAAEE